MEQVKNHTNAHLLFGSRRVDLLGIPVDTYTMEETVALIDYAIQHRIPITHAAINVAKFVSMQEDKQLYNAVASCSLINPDGYPIVWLARLLGHHMPERVTGIDLMEKLVELAAQRGYRIYFFGAEEWVVQKVVALYSHLYSPAIIAGWRNGYYAPEEEPEIAREIAAAAPDILFVAMSSPKKELFLWKYRDILSIPFVMGVGGSFDVIAGKVKRAPRWMQNAGLEWLFRLLQEPKRMWKRYTYTNLKFCWFLLRNILNRKSP